MTMRRFEVELSGTVTVEVDDEALSEPDEATGRRWRILEAHEDPRRYDPGATLDNVLGSLAIICGVDNRRVGRTDGWADFPEDAATANSYIDWEVDNVREVT